jgi:hypothetical protein
MATLEEIRRAREADRAGQAQSAPQGGNATLSAIRAARQADRGAMPAVQTPDGRSTAPGTSQDMADNVPPGMVFDERTGGYVDTALAAERMGPAQGASASFIAGAPFVGEYADEAMGRFDAAVSGRNPEIAQETMRQSRGQFQESNPGLALTAEIAGGVTGSLPLIAAAAPVVGVGSGLLQRAAIAGGIGAVAGGTEGAIQGYGAGTTPETRSAEAWQRGLIGAAAGGVLGAAAPLVGAGARAVTQRVRGIDVKAIADEFGVDRRTAAVIRGFLANDDLDAAAARLAQVGDDAMLADAGIGTAQALDTAMASGGRALRTGREAVETRASAASQRMAQTLDDVLGAPEGINTAARNIAQRTSAARSAAYDAAYRRPIDYAADAGRKVEGVLQRIPSRQLNAAVQEANEAMQEAGMRNMQIMAQIAPDGSVTFREMPNVQQLDFIKRALGDIAQRETDDFGRLTAAGLRSQRLASDLRDALGEAVPAYSRALRLGGDKIAEDNALRLGKDLLTRNVTVEQAAKAMRGASAEAKIAARQGLREGIETTLSNVRRTITDPNVDTREAMTLIKDMSSRANIAKLRTVLGKDEAERLFAEIDRTAAALELRALVATNSKTAVRQAGMEAVNDATAPGITGTLAQGRPVEAAQKALQELTGATDAAGAARREDVFGQIATALTQKRGQEAVDALNVVRAAMAGQPLRDQDAARIVKAVGVPLLSSLYQSGTRATELSLSNSPR